MGQIDCRAGRARRHLAADSPFAVLAADEKAAIDGKDDAAQPEELKGGRHTGACSGRRLGGAVKQAQPVIEHIGQAQPQNSAVFQPQEIGRQYIPHLRHPYFRSFRRNRASPAAVVTANMPMEHRAIWTGRVTVPSVN